MNTQVPFRFLLNPEITFLNFGSFGACEESIFEKYQALQREFEYEPVQFMTQKGPRLLGEAREALGRYLGANADELVFVPNPTYAMNIVVKSIQLGVGDEVLTTDLEYGAIDKTWQYYADQRGFRYVRTPISLPLNSESEFVEAFFAGYTPRTKAIFISQITSTTGLIFPVKAICKKAKELGLLTIVDGAHVPAHIPLNISEMDADIYTGACHKWMMTPKGSSFLFAKKEHHAWLDPLVVSWGYKSPVKGDSLLIDYHQQQGTRDFTAALTVPHAIHFLEKNKWENHARACRELVRSNIDRFEKLLNTSALAPKTDEFFGQMCSLEIKTTAPLELKETLYQRYKIEIPIMVHDHRTFIRYSIQVFNDQKDLDHLYASLEEIIKEGKLLSV